MFTFLFPQLVWIESLAQHAELKKLFQADLNDINYMPGDWGCSVKTTFQQERPNSTWDRYAECLQGPLLNMLSAMDFQVEVQVEIVENWKNLYNQGDFQEVHTHDPSDFSAVYFANYNPETDARLCLYNQHRSDIQFLNKYSSGWAKQYHPSSFVLEQVKEGDVVIFPSSTPHFTRVQNHNTNRLTIASNIDLKAL